MNANESMVDLLDIAHSALSANVIPSLPKADRYNALMVANAMRIVARHFGSASSGPATQASTSLLSDACVVKGIRAGQFDCGSVMRAALVTNLRNRLAQELAVDNPRLLETLQNYQRA